MNIKKTARIRCPFKSLGHIKGVGYFSATFMPETKADKKQTNYLK